MEGGRATSTRAVKWLTLSLIWISDSQVVRIVRIAQLLGNGPARRQLSVTAQLKPT